MVQTLEINQSTTSSESLKSWPWNEYSNECSALWPCVQISSFTIPVNLYYWISSLIDHSLNGQLHCPSYCRQFFILSSSWNCSWSHLTTRSQQIYSNIVKTSFTFTSYFIHPPPINIKIFTLLTCFLLFAPVSALWPIRLDDWPDVREFLSLSPPLFLLSFLRDGPKCTQAHFRQLQRDPIRHFPLLYLTCSSNLVLHFSVLFLPLLIARRSSYKVLLTLKIHSPRSTKETSKCVPSNARLSTRYLNRLYSNVLTKGCTRIIEWNTNNGPKKTFLK